MNKTIKKWLFGLVGLLVMSWLFLVVLFAWVKSLIDELKKINLVQIKMVLISFLALVGGIYLIWLCGMIFLFVYINYINQNKRELKK